MSTQALLASTWVTPGSPVGSFEGFRYAPVPTTVISAGAQFVVAALLRASPLDPWMVDDVHVHAVGVVGPGSGRIEIGGMLTDPTNIPPFSVYSVASASDRVIVSEPTSATLIALSLGGLALFCRTRRPATQAK